MRRLKDRLAALLRQAEVFRLWAFWPLVALLVHVIIFPYLYETRKVSPVPDLEQLIEHRGGYLGMFRSREVHVTYGRIGMPIYVERQVEERPGEIGVTAAQFLSVPGIVTRSGPVATAIELRLRKINPNLATRFMDFLKETAELNPGETAVFEIGSDPAMGESGYPVDKVVLVMLEERQDAKAYTTNVTKGLNAALATDHLAGSDGMIVTFLGIGTRNQPVPTARFLDILFDAFPEDAGGGRVFIGLFEGWPKDFLASVIRDLDRVWDRRTGIGLSGAIFSLQLRFALICLVLCLLVCSFSTVLSLKNAFLLSGAYLGSVFASDKMVSFFFSAFDPDVRVLVSLVVQVLLAMFFPVVAKLNPKGVFDKAKAG